MGSNYRWNKDTLKENKEIAEKGGTPVLAANPAGGGTGTYWNTTVLVNGSGFKAEDIIFENSFNQYISKNESEDIVVEHTSGGKGARPTTKGDTSV